MIFAQYKHAITFAVVILGLAVVVADPDKDDVDDATPAGETAVAANLAAPAPAPQAAPAAADAEWYGVTEEQAPPLPSEDPSAEDHGGYDLSPAPMPPAPAPRTQSRPAPVAAAAAAAPGYVPPPPPPQVPPGS